MLSYFHVFMLSFSLIKLCRLCVVCTSVPRWVCTFNMQAFILIMIIINTNPFEHHLKLAFLLTIPAWNLTVPGNWNLWWKRSSLSFAFYLPHLFHTNPPDRNFCETVFPHLPPFSQIWGKLISPSGNFVSQSGKHNFPQISPEFPNDSYCFPSFLCSFQ